MDYLKKIIYIPQIDKKDQIIGKVERWQAHRDSILHRGFTVALYFQDKIVIQHRRHQVFDGVYDVTCSSHPTYHEEKLESMIDSIYQALKREWNLSKKDLISEPKFINKEYYQSKDKNSPYSEHEICYFYKAELKTIPVPDLKFAYGSLLLSRDEILDKKSKVYQRFAPWVYKLFSLI